MPYIKENRKGELFGGEHPVNAGELNWTMTEVIIQYVETNGLSYQTINDIVGALEGAKAEFQRRVVAPYEDFKRNVNGEVYPQHLLQHD